MKVHEYRTQLAWSGSTSDYRSYSRTHQVHMADGQWQISADPAFRGDSSLPNPEQLLVAAASSCQLLSFLAVAARAGVEVLEYADDATGEMPVAREAMRVTRIVLRPRVTVRGADAVLVERLMHEAHEQCYIANSLTSEIVLEPHIETV